MDKSVGNAPQRQCAEEKPKLTSINKFINRQIKEGRSQTEVAKALGVSQSLLTHWKQGRKYPSYLTLKRLKKELGICFICDYHKCSCKKVPKRKTKKTKKKS